MRAAIYETFRQPPQVRDLPDPPCPEDGAIVRVAACGVCRSDHHGWAGLDPDIVLPHVPGHEFSGTVVEVGPLCRRVRKGDRVTAPFILGCGACGDCLSGNATICDQQIVVGFSSWGAFAEYLPVPRADFNLVALPEAIAFEDAAAMGCRVTTAYQALLYRAGLRPGEWVAIHGCGGVGLSAIAIAKAVGARVIGVDVRDESLALAKSAGADRTIDAANEANVGKTIRDLTGGGAHVSMDALGVTATFDNSLRGLRKFGRHVQVGMPTGSHAVVPLPLLEIVYSRQITICGTRGMPAVAFPPLLGMVENDAVDVASLITRRISLDDAASALAEMDANCGVGITVIDRFQAP